MALKRLPPTPWRRAKDAAHAMQAGLGRWYGRPAGGMVTDLKFDGRPVLFIHNPKAGGTSVGRFLHVKRLSHSFPRDVLRERFWVDGFVIVVVRDPFERFMSCYYGNVIRPQDNGLTKRYGRAVKSLTPAEFLDLLADNPKFGGPQTNWTDYPSSVKPCADLIIRFEELGSLGQTLADLGIDVGNRVLDHHNQSERGQSDHLARLGMSEEAFSDLGNRVRAFYAEDYAAFGYS